MEQKIPDWANETVVYYPEIELIEAAKSLAFAGDFLQDEEYMIAADELIEMANRLHQEALYYEKQSEK